MAKIETHIEDCMRLLGAPFEDVHRFLDSYSMKYPPRTHLEYHRKFLHNRKGVLMCKEKFGPLGEKAAKIHLIRDAEIYILKKPFREVMGDEIDELYERCLQFHPPENTDEREYTLE